MIYNVSIDNKDYKLELIDGGKSIEIRLDGRTMKIDNYRLKTGRQEISRRQVSFLKDNRPYLLEILKGDGAYDCWLGCRSARCEVVDEKAARYAKLVGNKVSFSKTYLLKAPMPGLVKKVEVEIGQSVKKGDGLVIVEAMKMENELKADRPGTIKDIKVKAGQAIEKNQELVAFE